MCVFLDDPGLPLIGFGFRNGMCSYVCGLGLGDCGELRARGRLKWRLGCRVMADKRVEAGGHESRPDGREVDMSFLLRQERALLAHWCEGSNYGSTGRARALTGL